MNELLRTALRWHERGINTFAAYPNSKYLLKNTDVIGHRDKLMSAADVIGQFVGRRYNLAILPAHSPVANRYLVCLDFDALPPWLFWQHKMGIETLTTDTRQGKHVFFWCVQPPENLVSAVADIELKYLMPVTEALSKVRGYEYLDNGAEIATVDKVQDVLKCETTPSKEEDSQVTVHIKNNYGTINVGSSFTRRKSIIEQIKEHYPITAIFEDYRPNDKGMAIARCPMPAHERGDRHPSLSLDLNTNRFRCFRPDCPLHLPHGGDVIDAYRIVNGLSFRATLAELAHLLGL